MRILEEFWYGNVEPTEYNTYFCKNYRNRWAICQNDVGGYRKTTISEYIRTISRVVLTTTRLVFHSKAKVFPNPGFYHTCVVLEYAL